MMSKERKDHKHTHPVRRVIKWVILCFLMFIAVAFIYLVIRLYPSYKEYTATANTILLDMTEENFMRLGNTYIYDRDDDLIGEIGNEKYEYVPLDKVSDDVIYGYVANEDKNFFSHNGIDFRALARAALALVRNNGEITQGGSTITQQVVKNNILSQEQTYERKILEILIAVRLERMYSKNDIMEFYVNSCYYGENCYGIEGAAQYYFGVSANDLSLGEAAMLVASSVSPSTHNPAADYEYMMDRKAVVLDEMVEEGYITSTQAAAAKEERPVVVKKSENVDADNYMISYAIHCAAIELMHDEGFKFEYTFSTSDESDEYEKNYNEVYNEAVNTVRAGGYKLYTSFDTGVQETLQSAVDSGLAEFMEQDEDGTYSMQGAAVCIDNDTGFVIAAVGGREAADSYNRAYQAKREAGSAIKPLLDYGPALSEGIIYPDTVYNDERFDDDGYSPTNAGDSYYGNVTIREAVARSLNTVALQVFIDDGMDTSLSYLDDMQFNTLTYADSTMDGIALGAFANGITVSDMARGYYTLENGGEYTDASCLRRIETNSGDDVYNVDDDAITKQVYIPDAAFMMTDMMQGVFRENYGTAHKAYNSSMICAGKTGTTNDSKDGWFCGYSAYYTCAVWVGYDDPIEVDGLSGGSYPLTIWSTFMNDMHSDLEKKDFTVPNTVYMENSSGEVRTVNTESGDVYASRPEGFEYRSSTLDAKERDRERKRQEAEAVKEAETALTEFEAIVISSYEDAVNLDSYYNEVVEKINLISDIKTREGLLERAAKKYETLSDEVVSAWGNASEKIAEAEAAQRDEDVAAAAGESLTAAQAASSNATSQTESSRKNAVEMYISYLNQAEYHTSAVDQMIADARTALSKCTSYTWYSDASNRLSSAISRAQNLPTEAESVPQVVEEEVEQEPDINDYEDGLNEYNATQSSGNILFNGNTAD